METPTQPLAVRHLQGVGWQVLLTEPHAWHTCRNELDARYIANGLDLAAAVTRGEQSGQETADELDEVASTLVRNIGACLTEQIIRASADRARGRSV